MNTIKLDKKAIQDLTDRMLAARESNLKMVLDIQHRLELVAEKDGVEYLNDSKSTTVNSTYYSLTCIQKPVVWLVSCMDHPQNLARLRELVGQKVSSILYLGHEEDPFVEEFVQQVDVIQSFDNMAELIAEARKLAEPGDCVLFSPATAVSERYSGYAQRGEDFRQAVRNL